MMMMIKRIDFLLLVASFSFILILSNCEPTNGGSSSSAKSESSSGSGSGSGSESGSGSKSTSQTTSSSGLKSHSSNRIGSRQGIQQRQAGLSLAGSLLTAVTNMVPNLITNVAPLVLLFGIGALMMPALGLGSAGLLRDSRRSSNEPIPIGPFSAGPSGPFGPQYIRPLQATPQEIYYFSQRSMPSLMSNVNKANLVAGFSDLLERAARAVENADKRYS